MSKDNKEGFTELYIQQGYVTVMQKDSKRHVFTFEMNGQAIREVGLHNEKMVSSQGHALTQQMLEYELSKLEWSMHKKDADVYVKMKKPIVNKDMEECFLKAVSMVKGLGIDINIALSKQAATVINDGVEKHKTMEHRLFSAWDRRAADSSQYLANVEKHGLESFEPWLGDTIEWIKQRRSLSKHIKNGEYDIVFAPGKGAIVLHEIVGHELELRSSADTGIVHVGSHFPYKPCRDFTMFDSNHILVPGHDFDDEGTPVSDTVLVKNGKIMTPLSDKRTVLRSTGYALTGNARRESYLHYPHPRAYRTYVQNGSSTLSQALGEIDYGFYVEEISYAFANRMDGSAYCCCSKARIIKNGTLTDEPAIFQFKISKSKPLVIRHICDDLEFFPGGCNAVSGKLYVEFGSPSMSAANVPLTHMLTR